MFFESELKRHSKFLGKEFGAEEVRTMISQAITELKNRNIAGAVIVPLSYIVGGFATEYASEQSFVFSFLGIVLSVTILLRVLSIIALSQKDIPGIHIWLPIFFWSNVFVAVIWASFTATAILLYHDSISITLIVILLAGIGGGSMASYCIWKTLSYTYLIIILGIPVVAELYIGNLNTVTIGIAILFFLFFNLAQAKLWNRHYWVSLINSYVVKVNAMELTKLNTQLTKEIADHKHTSENIAISRKKLQDIFNSAHDGIFLFELNGHVIDINDTMLKMFNVDRQDALKFDVNCSFQSSLNKDTDLKNIWKNAANGIDQEFAWLTNTAESDGIATVQVNLRKTLWGDDSIIIATVRNISEQVSALEATIAANQAKTEFLANMSHELRTPMHGILGYARLGKKRFETVPREKLKEYFNLIGISGERLMELLNNVLDFSKLEVGKMCYDFRETNILSLIHQAANELTPVAAEKNIHFKISNSEDTVQAYCDHEKIMQVLRNILVNGIKFSFPNNPIQITCKPAKSDSSPSGVEISISNTGVPIPEDELGTVFEKFTQSTATQTGAGGTGLGLAISKQIITGHEGTIWASKGENNTTVFHFTLPAGGKENSD